jgi:CRP/FNR family transcriptional regulator, cyclic AMP receptor protein
MLLLIEAQAEAEEICHRIKEISAALIAGVGPQKTRKIFSASEDLAREHFSGEKFFVVREGAVRFLMSGSLFMLYEEGDLLGLDIQQNLSGVSFTSDFAVTVEEFSKADFLRVTLGNPELSKMWLEYLNLQARLFLIVSAQQMKAGLKLESEVEQFKKGEVIIKQGSQSRDVFTLVEGAADVLVDGVRVGEIKSNQIFGALAAMTGTARSASVVARQDCTVVSLPEDHFVDLIRSRPETVMQLCKDMAETIITLNNRVVEGVKVKTPSTKK